MAEKEKKDKKTEPIQTTPVFRTEEYLLSQDKNMRDMYQIQILEMILQGILQLNQSIKDLSLEEKDEEEDK